MYRPVRSGIKNDSFPIYDAEDFILWFLDYPISYYPRSSLSDLLRVYVVYSDDVWRDTRFNCIGLPH